MPSALCQVCGTNLELPAPVVCELCETPHHEDCWRYLGCCSRYGCNGLKIETPETALVIGASHLPALPPLPVAGRSGHTWALTTSAVTWSDGASQPAIPKGGAVMRLGAGSV